MLFQFLYLFIIFIFSLFILPPLPPSPRFSTSSLAAWNRNLSFVLENPGTYLFSLFFSSLFLINICKIYSIFLYIHVHVFILSLFFSIFVIGWSWGLSFSFFQAAFFHVGFRAFCCCFPSMEVEYYYNCLFFSPPFILGSFLICLLCDLFIYWCLWF